MTALAKITGTEKDDWAALCEQAQAALDSGFLPKSIAKPAQAIAIAMAGRELGLPTMAAYRLIHVIEGKISISAEGMLALAYANVAGFGHQIVQNDDNGARVMMWRSGVQPTEFSFTRKQADAAGLTGKDVWRKYGPRMFLWRAIKWGVQAIAPDVTFGVPSTDEVEEIAEERPKVTYSVAPSGGATPATPASGAAAPATPPAQQATTMPKKDPPAVTPEWEKKATEAETLLRACKDQAGLAVAFKQLKDLLPRGKAPIELRERVGQVYADLEKTLPKDAAQPAAGADPGGAA